MARSIATAQSLGGGFSPMHRAQMAEFDVGSALLQRADRNLCWLCHA